MSADRISRRSILGGAACAIASTWARAGHAATTRMPVAFVSHGSPRLPIEPARAEEIRAWGATLPRPRGIVVMTPHFGSRALAFGPRARGVAMYDMPDWIKQQLPQGLTYATPPSDGLADRVEHAIGVSMKRIERRGFDHTTWMPLSYLFPAADAPVVEVAYPFRKEADMFALGRKLAPLRDEGILVLGSGQMTHNLASFDPNGDHAPPKWSIEFDAWATEAIRARDVDALVDFRHRAPAAEVAHPDDGGHYRVMLFALGAALGDGSNARVQFPVTGFDGTLSKRCVQID